MERKRICLVQRVTTRHSAFPNHIQRLPEYRETKVTEYEMSHALAELPAELYSHAAEHAFS
jgi:hypothetical protein